MDEMSVQEWLLGQSYYSDRIVLKFNGMPYWLSSSDDMTILSDQSWREFMTHHPADYNLWDSIITAVVEKVAGWGFHPYYEIWNEPDGDYWHESDAELLKLYKHTALAIKNADPEAKVGAYGMHTWWRSVDPDNYPVQQQFTSPLYGPIHDSVPEQYAIIYMLLDSVINNWQADNVPLDFISYHFFRWYPYDITRTANQIRNKMFELGYCPPDVYCFTGPDYPELYISEWQTTYGIQEKLFQPPLYLKIMKGMADADINFHSIAAISDFGGDPDNEFTEGWGMISQNGIVKPVFSALRLLDDVISHGGMLQVDVSDGIGAFSSIKDDTLRLLFCNYSMPIQWYSSYYKVAWSSWERMLYDSTSVFSAPDYIDEGYTSYWWGNNPPGEWGSVDEIFFGYYDPFPGTPMAMENSLLLGREQFYNDSLRNAQTNYVEIEIEGQYDSLVAIMIRIDSTHNNIIHIYDSLRAIASYSHQRAVDSLQSCTFTGGCYGVLYDHDTIVFEGGVFDLWLDPNSVIYLKIPGVDLHVGFDESVFDEINIKVYPNPVSAGKPLTLSNITTGYTRIDLYDVQGVYQDNLYEGYLMGEQISINPDDWLPGVYILKILNGRKVIARKVVVF